MWDSSFSPWLCPILFIGDRFFVPTLVIGKPVERTVLVYNAWEYFSNLFSPMFRNTEMSRESDGDFMTDYSTG